MLIVLCITCRRYVYFGEKKLKQLCSVPHHYFMFLRVFVFVLFCFLFFFSKNMKIRGFFFFFFSKNMKIRVFFFFFSKNMKIRTNNIYGVYCTHSSTFSISGISIGFAEAVLGLHPKVCSRMQVISFAYLFLVIWKFGIQTICTHEFC